MGGKNGEGVAVAQQPQQVRFFSVKAERPYRHMATVIT